MPSPEQYFAVATAFRYLQKSIDDIDRRVERRREFTKSDRTETEFQVEIEKVCQDLKEDIKDLLHVLEGFSLACAEIQMIHWADIEVTHREYIKLNAEYLPKVGRITRRGSDGTAQRVPAHPDLDWSTKKVLQLLLQIYDGLIDYWLLWCWVYTYETAAKIRGDH